jgi:two-component sensor histidine kinase
MWGGVFKDVTERKEAEQRRLDAAVAQRDALVREVHHRIKNNLQGITGMLRQLATAHPELRQAMALAITQVQTVAVIHGLQSRTVSDRVAVCELTSSIAAHVESLLRTKLAVEVDLNRISRAWICETEAVPVALILNELMFNAVKHSQSGPPIRVAVGGTAGQAEVRILNPGRLPEGFDFRAGRGIGVGLQLVGSLLPRRGAQLSIRNCAEGVETVLALDAPVIAAFTARWEMP